MDETIELYADLFNLQEVEDQSVTRVLPDISGNGISFRTRNGEVLGRYETGVSEGYGQIYNGENEIIATVSPDARGGSLLKTDHGESVHISGNEAGQSVDSTFDNIGILDASPLGGYQFHNAEGAVPFTADLGITGVEISKKLKLDSLESGGDMMDLAGAASIALDAEEAGSLMDALAELL